MKASSNWGSARKSHRLRAKARPSIISTRRSSGWAAPIARCRITPSLKKPRCRKSTILSRRRGACLAGGLEMPTEVILPRVDMDMTEGMIAAWHVKEGDEVREGTLIFEIETSKATMEIDAPASGIIRQINAPVGKTVPVGTAVAWIYAVGEA